MNHNYIYLIFLLVFTSCSLHDDFENNVEEGSSVSFSFLPIKLKDDANNTQIKTLRMILFDSKTGDLIENKELTFANEDHTETIATTIKRGRNQLRGDFFFIANEASGGTNFVKFLKEIQNSAEFRSLISKNRGNWIGVGKNDEKIDPKLQEDAPLLTSRYANFDLTLITGTLNDPTSFKKINGNEKLRLYRSLSKVNLNLIIKGPRRIKKITLSNIPKYYSPIPIDDFYDASQYESYDLTLPVDSDYQKNIIPYTIYVPENLIALDNKEAEKFASKITILTVDNKESSALIQQKNFDGYNQQSLRSLDIKKLSTESLLRNSLATFNFDLQTMGWTLDIVDWDEINMGNAINGGISLNMDKKIIMDYNQERSFTSTIKFSSSKDSIKLLFGSQKTPYMLKDGVIKETDITNEIPDLPAWIEKIEIGSYHSYENNMHYLGNLKITYKPDPSGRLNSNYPISISRNGIQKTCIVKYDNGFIPKSLLLNDLKKYNAVTTSKTDSVPFLFTGARASAYHKTRISHTEYYLAKWDYFPVDVIEKGWEGFMVAKRGNKDVKLKATEYEKMVPLGHYYYSTDTKTDFFNSYKAYPIHEFAYTTTMGYFNHRIGSGHFNTKQMDYYCYFTSNYKFSISFKYRENDKESYGTGGLFFDIQRINSADHLERVLLKSYHTQNPLNIGDYQNYKYFSGVPVSTLLFPSDPPSMLPTAITLSSYWGLNLNPWDIPSLGTARYLMYVGNDYLGESYYFKEDNSKFLWTSSLYTPQDVARSIITHDEYPWKYYDQYCGAPLVVPMTSQPADFLEKSGLYPKLRTAKYKKGSYLTIFEDPFSVAYTIGGIYATESQIKKPVNRQGVLRAIRSAYSFERP